MENDTTQTDVYSDAESFVDAYSTQLSISPLLPDHATILEEKRSKKQLEDDTMRLRNRVRALLKEEERVRKEMHTTEARIERTMQMKEEKERRAFEKAVRREIEKRQVAHRRETNWQSRRDREYVRKQKQAQIYEEKIQAARDAKREKTENRRLYVQDKSSELRKAQERKDSVKQVESCIKKNLQLHQSTKLNKAQEDYNKRLGEERQARVEKEQELTQLMRTELELISKLKVKQDEQEEQYDRLKSCLGRKSKRAVRKKASLIPTATTCFAMETRSGVQQLLLQFDRKSNGTFATSHLEKVLRCLNCRLSTQQTQDVRQKLDPERSGSIAHDRFVSWWWTQSNATTAPSIR